MDMHMRMEPVQAQTLQFLPAYIQRFHAIAERVQDEETAQEIVALAHELEQHLREQLKKTTTALANAEIDFREKAAKLEVAFQLTEGQISQDLHAIRKTIEVMQDDLTKATGERKVLQDELKTVKDALDRVFELMQLYSNGNGGNDHGG